MEAKKQQLDAELQKQRQVIGKEAFFSAMGKSPTGKSQMSQSMYATASPHEKGKFDELNRTVNTLQKELKRLSVEQDRLQQIVSDDHRSSTGSSASPPANMHPAGANSMSPPVMTSFGSQQFYSPAPQPMMIGLPGQPIMQPIYANSPPMPSQMSQMQMEFRLHENFQSDGGLDPIFDVAQNSNSSFGGMTYRVGPNKGSGAPYGMYQPNTDISRTFVRQHPTTRTPLPQIDAAQPSAPAATIYGTSPPKKSPSAFPRDIAESAQRLSPNRSMNSSQDEQLLTGSLPTEPILFQMQQQPLYAVPSQFSQPQQSGPVAQPNGHHVVQENSQSVALEIRFDDKPLSERKPVPKRAPPLAATPKKPAAPSGPVKAAPPVPQNDPNVSSGVGKLLMIIYSIPRVHAKR